MREFGDNALIELWERGTTRGPLDRALLLLGAASPELATKTLADLSVTERDARVLALRSAMFGEIFDGIANCPDCAEPLEFRLDGAALRSRHQHTEVEFVTAGGLHFRLPNSRDLAMAIADESEIDGDDSGVVRVLIHRCCLNATESTEWSPELFVEAEAGLDALTEGAGLQLRFHCEACGADWDAPLDICAWLWREIDRRARALLDEVHQLAWAYGWDEQRILDMSPIRRAGYIERCGERREP